MVVTCGFLCFDLPVVVLDGLCCVYGLGGCLEELGGVVGVVGFLEVLSEAGGEE